MSTAPDSTDIVDEMLSLGLVDEAQAEAWYKEIAVRNGTDSEPVRVTMKPQPEEEEVGADLDMDEADMPVDFPEQTEAKKPEAPKPVETPAPKAVSPTEPVKKAAEAVPAPAKAAAVKKPAEKTGPKRMTASADYLAAKIDLGNGVTRTAQEMIASFSAVKVKEKAKEFSRYVVSGGSLSVYTTIGIKMLRETGGCAGAKLARRMMDGVDGKRYSVGTARAQAQQVHNLLMKFNVIDKEGKPVPESPIAKKLLET